MSGSKATQTRAAVQEVGLREGNAGAFGAVCAETQRFRRESARSLIFLNFLYYRISRCIGNSKRDLASWETKAPLSSGGGEGELD